MPEEAGGLSKKRGKEVNSVNFSRRRSHNGMSQKHLGFGKMNTYSNCLYMYRISLERNAAYTDCPRKKQVAGRGAEVGKEALTLYSFVPSGFFI